MVFCPECGSKISSRACMCSKCGYVSVNYVVPISDQESCNYVNIVTMKRLQEEENLQLVLLQYYYYFYLSLERKK